MSSDSGEASGIDRRSFLKGAAAAGAAAALAGRLAETAHAQEASEKPSAAAKPSAGTARALLSSITITRPGSDFMVDVLKSLGIEFLAANPGSSFRSLQESIVNYGGNSKPEFITAMHEERRPASPTATPRPPASRWPSWPTAQSVCSSRHGRLQRLVRPRADLHDGRQHGGRDQAPAGRRVVPLGPGPAAFLRDFTKWDDQPASLQHFAESAVRAYKIATTPPMEPVLIVSDLDLQESEVENASELSIPKLSPSIPPQADANALREAARLLAAAQSPVILADRAIRNSDGVKLMVQLAEARRANRGPRRANEHAQRPFRQPVRHEGPAHPRCGLHPCARRRRPMGPDEQRRRPHHDYRRIAKPDVKVAHISLGDTYLKANYQDFERFQSVDSSIQGDVQTSLPPLIEAIKSEVGSKASGKVDSLKELFQRQAQQTVTNASYGWDASPITTARLAAETWNVIRTRTSRWPRTACPAGPAGCGR